MNFEAIFYDFDGVMTDNTVQISQDGSEFVRVNRGDGLAISEIKKLKIYQAIISTEKNPVVKARSEKLQIPCFQGVLNKLNEVNNICEAKKINLKNSAFIGNDINDKEVMESIGLSACPSDSNQTILGISDIILQSKGGDGVIREFYDYILGEIR